MKIRKSSIAKWKQIITTAFHTILKARGSINNCNALKEEVIFMKFCKVMVIVFLIGYFFFPYQTQGIAGVEGGSYAPNESGCSKCWACEGRGYYIDALGRRHTCTSCNGAGWRDYREYRDTEQSRTYSRSTYDYPGAACFIATAVQGDSSAREVQILCQFRDLYLSKSGLGRSVVSLYYKISPHIAPYVKRNEILKAICHRLLSPIVQIVEWKMKNKKSDYKR